MKKRSIAVVLAAAGLAPAACGSSHPAAKPTAPSAPVAAGPDPCSLLTSAELSSVLHTSNPKGTRLGTRCSYAYGPRGVQVIAMTATAANRAAVATHHPGAIALRGPGVRGYAQVINPISTASSGQALATLVKGPAFLDVVVTDPGRGRAALLAEAGRLGRAAAARL